VILVSKQSKLSGQGSLGVFLVINLPLMVNPIRFFSLASDNINNSLRMFIVNFYLFLSLHIY